MTIEIGSLWVEDDRRFSDDPRYVRVLAVSGPSIKIRRVLPDGESFAPRSRETWAHHKRFGRAGGYKLCTLPLPNNVDGKR